MQEIVGAFIIGVFVGICLGYVFLYGDVKELNKQYSENINILQDELNYYRRNENIK